MSKKKIGMILTIAAVLGLAFITYQYMKPDEYIPADDEIALHIQLDTEQAVGLLVYDYCADGHTYSGGISNADKTMIKSGSDNIVAWNKEELNNPSDPFDLSVQFRIITEYVEPNFENVYPENITKYAEPISWEAHFGKSYFITITGNNATGYKAALGAMD